MTRYVVALTGAILAALSLLIVVGAGHGADFSLLGEINAKSSLERCYRRCEKNNPPIPSPEPTRSPKPIPCEPIGTKHYADNEEKMLCFDVPPGPGALVELQSKNAGNASCAYMEMTCTSPKGEVYHSGGAQPGCVFAKSAGRYYAWTKFVVDPAKEPPLDICRTYTFTVLK